MRRALMLEILILLAVAIAPAVHAGVWVANDSTTGFNSASAKQNLNEILVNAESSSYNTVQLFSGGDCPGSECLWIPWFSSSTACTQAELKTYGSCTGTSLAQNKSVMVTDEFSEAAMVMCAGNASQERYCVAAMNTADLLGVKMTTYGDLPIWAACRANSSISDLSGQDGASDATHRLVIAFYTAANNSNFAAGNRSRAAALASKLMNQSLQYDTTGSGVSKTAGDFGSSNYWLFLGEDSANAGFTAYAAEDQYTGYWQDAIAACLIHAKQTGNATVANICSEWVKQALAMSQYHGGTTAASFKTGYYRMWYSSDPVVPADCGGACSYYFIAGNPSWDTADAPRFGGLCYNLRLANYSGLYTMSSPPWKNLTDYCAAWAAQKGTTWTATAGDAQACQQYRQNGSCFAGPFDSVRLVGMLAPGVMGMSAGDTANVMTELNRHYSWSTHLIDGSACGNGLTYDTVRFPKAIYYGIGYPDPLVGGPDPRTSGGSTPPPATPAPVISNVANSSITSSGFTVTWTTDISSDSTVYYGTTNATTSSSYSSTLTTSHSIPLSGLSSSTLYYFKASSCNAGNCTNSTLFNVTTSAAAPDCSAYSNTPLICYFGLSYCSYIANMSCTVTRTAYTYAQQRCDLGAPCV